MVGKICEKGRSVTAVKEWLIWSAQGKGCESVDVCGDCLVTTELLSGSLTNVYKME